MTRLPFHGSPFSCLATESRWSKRTGETLNSVSTELWTSPVHDVHSLVQSRKILCLEIQLTENARGVWSVSVSAFIMLAEHLQPFSLSPCLIVLLLMLIAIISLQKE